MKAVKGVLLITNILFLGSCSGGNSWGGKEKIKEVKQMKTSNGERIYEARCVVCHGENGHAGIANAAELQGSKLSKDAIITIVKNGRGGMPSFNKQLDETEIRQLANYVKSLSTAP